MSDLFRHIELLGEAKSTFSGRLGTQLKKMSKGYGSSSPQEGKLYSITGSGLVPVESGVLNIQANQIYSMGASDFPKQVYITKAPDKDGVFYYRNVPFSKDSDHKGTVKYLEDLILQGTKRELKNLQGSQFQSPHTRNRVSRIKALLANKKTHPEKLTDYDQFTVIVRPVGGKDYWRVAEMYGGVGGVRDKANPDIFNYHINGVYKNALYRLKKDKRFEILSIKKE
jgi:hypothetical protein